MYYNCGQFEGSDIIRDKNGRYFIKKGKLFHKLIVLKIMFASNWSIATIIITYHFYF